MTDNTYNGWTNWETWQFPLWIDNDEGTYLEKRRMLQREHNEIDNIKAKEIALAIFPEGTPDMTGDDMGRVDWTEIAEHWEDERLEMEADNA